MSKLNSRKRRRNYVKEHNLGNNKVKTVWIKESPFGNLYDDKDSGKVYDKFVNRGQKHLIQYAKQYGYKHPGSRTLRNLKYLHGYSTSRIGNMLRFMSQIK